MLLAGTDDGLFGVTGLRDPANPDVERVLDPGAVMRIRRFDGVDAVGGLFAATETGLYHSRDGDEWTNLDVPREKVYAVGASPDGDLYAGTRPAHLYVADASGGVDDLAWRELDGLQDVPSRDEWRLPRHENLAQVRDVHVPAGAPDRVVVGVEVGGVHVSDDGGATWTERRGGVSAGEASNGSSQAEGSDGVHDDVHELAVVGPDEFVAATGYGLFRTLDGGESWTRLDDGYDQRYFRSVLVVDGDVYAGGALAHTATWDDEDADPALFVAADGQPLEPVERPHADETVTGMTSVDGDVVAATHRGTMLREGADGWTAAGSLPVPDGHAVSYTPLLWAAD